MNLLSCSRWLSPSIFSAALVACANLPDAGPPTVVRTAAPQGYEKTISNYFAFKVRGSQKNSELRFGAPEPGDCPLDGYLASSRGWVVPVVHATRRGEATGRETINITTRQYYFWFLGNTIAGITPRIELCPGIITAFNDAAPVADVASPAAIATPARPEAERRGAVDTAEPSKRTPPALRAPPARGKKHAAAHPGKKASASSAKLRRPAKKAAGAGGPARPELKW